LSGDGNCLYRALESQERRLSLPRRTFHDIRIKVAEFMTENPVLHVNISFQFHLKYIFA
jgi:hypothetical protein